MGFTIKKSTLYALLKKAYNMGSNEVQRFAGIMFKLKEFKLLAYPVGLRKLLCAQLARDTDDKLWYAIRGLQT